MAINAFQLLSTSRWAAHSPKNPPPGVGGPTLLVVVPAHTCASAPTRVCTLFFAHRLLAHSPRMQVGGGPSGRSRLAHWRGRPVAT